MAKSKETSVDLLIVNGPAEPLREPNPSYRGTFRAVPTYCDALRADHEINRLFIDWYLVEGGELGVVHDLPKARRFAELWNQQMGEPCYEVVEVVVGRMPPVNKGELVGFDLSVGFHYSLLWQGLRRPPGWVLPQSIDVLLHLMERYFVSQLNKSGLFQTFEMAAFCLRVMTALQGLHPNLFEVGDLSEFQVFGIYSIA
jgi:hypothetical protein